ncbi:MAG: hypothetical protein EBZ36_09950, partial [Acidobacteria bacterium]|nr:hypothetical protein [Acidobacteriota bacterium]
MFNDGYLTEVGRGDRGSLGAGLRWGIAITLIAILVILLRVESANGRAGRIDRKGRGAVGQIGSDQGGGSSTAVTPVSDGGAGVAGVTASTLVNQTCTVNCSATVPSSGIVSSEISFQASVNASACTAPPVYEWSFGDGSAKSTLQNPRYSYPVAGTYQWSMRATIPGDSMQISTLAGGFGEGNPAVQAALRDVAQLAVDPLGRGVYIADTIGDVVLVRFVNTGTGPVTIAGV